MAAATMYVTPAGAGAKDGAAWASAMGEAEFEADLEANAEAGDIYYVQAGTYTLDSAYDASAKDGTAVGPISIIGVVAATTEEPPPLSRWGSGDDRPLFALGAYTFTTGDYFKIFNCRFTGTAATGLVAGNYAVVYNCYFRNTSGTAGRTACTITNSFIINSECISDNGIALSLGSAAKAIFCYAHDSVTGINMNASNLILFCIADTCSTAGIAETADIGGTVFGNTIYNCPIGVSGTTGFHVFINNIIDTATDGFKWTTQTDINFFAYNHAGNNVTDMWDLVEETVAAHKDNWATSGDPLFTSAAGGSFSLGTASPCLSAGMKITLGVS
jgi:hypothetical protein